MTTTTSADGTVLGYDAVGTGPTLLIVDGATVSRSYGSSNRMAEHLSDRFTVVSYDRRGRGESTDNTATAGDAVQREIEDIDALITAAGAPAVAFGMSSGAMLLLRAAAELGPDRIAAIALYEPPLMPEGGRDDAAAYTAALTAALGEGRRGDAAALFLARVGMPAEAVDGMRGSPAWAGLEAIAPTLAYDDAAMGDSSVPDVVVARVRIPVLTLAGGASPRLLQYGARELAQHLEDAAFEEVDGQTHDADPAAVAAHLRRFFPGRG